MAPMQLLLDLDNTLVSAEAVEDFPFDDSNVKQTAVKYTFHDMDGYYIIFERPKVQEFLDYVFKNFTVSIWTAASKEYALFIIKHIILKDPSRKLSYIFFSDHCKLSTALYDTPKYLGMLSEVFQLPQFSDENILIIDDLSDVYECQPDKCINIKPFEILQEKERDNELMSVVVPILNEYKSIKTK